MWTPMLQHSIHKETESSTTTQQGAATGFQAFNKKNSVALVRERTILTEHPPLVGEVSANVWSAWRIAYDRNLGFLDRSRYFFFQVVPKFCSRY
jgi:hypothetical protein